MIKITKTVVFSCTLLCSAYSLAITSSQAEDSIEDIVNQIKLLEKERDPKCYATASRLEDFMFGTPLSNEARFSKNLLQKQFAQSIWEKASVKAKQNGQSSVTLETLNQALAGSMRYQQGKDDHWQVTYSDGKQININNVDKRQYSTIAYALRAILAVQQESLFDLNSNLLPIDQEVIGKLKEALDLHSLAVLKISDEKARRSDKHEISVDNLVSVWTELLGPQKSEAQKKGNPLPAKTAEPQAADLSLIKKIIKQKVDSYEVYNNISQQLFIRNLQVYFARVSWPKDPEEAKQFQTLYTETLIQFASDFYLESEKIALARGHSTIQEKDVQSLVDVFIPHQIDEYEDALFFPKLGKSDQVAIESYDMDSFRDGGLHWRYLEFAINSPDFNAKLQPDPFALELITENIAQFGVLSLRTAGDIAKSQNQERISSAAFVSGLKSIQAKVNRHASIKSVDDKENKIVSSGADAAPQSSTTFFTDISSATGIDFMHRTSDWLNRQLRSYLDKGEGVGVITIPPAFGGSGVAAEDINNDGYDDILILGGLGNKLYLNKNGEKFVDITESSGLGWKRETDNTPGEPRQPIIADLDNDGLQDIVITYVEDSHRAYKNLGNGQFEDVTDIANLGGTNLVGGPATVADFDNDGLLDIYITYFGHYTKGVLPTLKRRNDNGLPNQLFKNMGGFKFKNITKGSGTANTGWGQAVAHTDLDGDGLQDLIVGNDFGVNAYLKNMGNNQFKNISKELGTDKPSYTMNIGIADLNQDLRPDIYISNIVTMNKDEKYVLPNEDTTMKFNAEKLANMRVVEANDLFLSRPGTSPSYELSDAVGRGYSSTGWSWDADFFDFDNDGDNDLYVTNGMNEFNIYSSANPYYTDPHSNEAKNVYMPVATKESNVFFVNQNGKLNNRSKESGMDLVGNSRSAAYLDFDNDGDLDVILNNYHEKAYFYRNELEGSENSSNWVKVKLIGDPTKGVSRDAIGARIVLHTSAGDKIWREVHSTIGYMSAHPKEQHIGLGDQKIDKVNVIWPNGDTTTIDTLTLNHSHVIEQK
ncbi:CRTAC1 family protein [Gilvimarinus sp. SDUM040013]|uniref:CRTAC1 family protein n=1 Tax=Gilvimarinus gilvus TaxID=3058038 RepID=A0ABU4RVU9_9GAMM|nr:CRTAC1 family protein [Gilvimarinus sp. SDUM040013]MDO3387311.1 CRTAC1 family protein [Gilvimarinus sp. SDUM040013]MDX6849000.1 CRTAC1 family protein [Gilvimarinus sp. SDUM040013]